MLTVPRTTVRTGGPTRVFLADDHALIREGLAAPLERTPECEVVGRVEQTRPDVVVLDGQLVGLAGPEVWLGLRRGSLPAAVLILSVHDSEDSMLRSLESGVSEYMLKESARADLLEAMRTVVDGGDEGAVGGGGRGPSGRHARGAEPVGAEPVGCRNGRTW